MKILITSATICDGAIVDAGEIVETSKETAQLLIGLQKAEPVKATVETAAAKGKKETATGPHAPKE